MINYMYYFILGFIVLGLVIPIIVIEFKKIHKAAKELEAETKLVQWRNSLKDKFIANTKAFKVLEDGTFAPGVIDYFHTDQHKFHFTADDKSIEPAFVEDEKILLPLE